MNKRKKLVLICQYWYPVIGGISTHMMNLHSGIKKHTDLEVKVIFKEGMSRDKDEIFIPAKNKLIFSLLTFKELMKNKPDIVNTHGAWYINIPTIIYKFIRPKTLIIQSHHTDPGKLLTGIKKMIYEKMLSMYNYNIFVSKYLLRRYSHYKIKSKKRVINSAIDVKTIKIGNIPEFKKTYDIKKNDKIISYIGNFAWDLKSKGVEQLIKSMPYVIEKDDSIRLLIIGKGEYQERSKTLVKKLGLERKVIFTGSLRDISTPLKISKIYVHITYQDAFSNSILEAMASKTPTIASDYGATREIISNGKTGILVKNNSKAIAREIIKLMSDYPKRKYLANNAYRIIKKNFTWEKIVLKYKNVFEEK